MVADTLRVGNVLVTHVLDVPPMPGAPRVMFPDVAEARWEPYKAQFTNERGHLTMAVGGFLIRSGGRTIAVDTGVGRKPRGPMFRTELAAFLNNIGNKGVRAEDVDLVLNTHLHGDHVGWNCIQDG